MMYFYISFKPPYLISQHKRKCQEIRNGKTAIFLNHQKGTYQLHKLDNIDL